MSKTDFKSLLDYYRQCFELVDVFHFNSNLAKIQFENVLGNVYNKVVPIAHQGITDNRIVKQFDSPKLRLGFIGAETSYKGLPLLKQTLSKIGSSKWCLNVWGGRVAVEKDLPVYYRGKFNQQNISQVYNGMDLLVVPSIWKETFSLVTLEALSYGVPVLVSNNVGAQDIVKEYEPSFVYATEDDLLNKLSSLINDRTELRQYNAAIVKNPWRHDMLNHAHDVIENVYKD